MATRAMFSVVLLCGWLAAQQRPNILVVVADDLGVDGVGCYAEGAAPPPTPTIDSLAARGVLFRNAWANAVCSPTRACVMAGRYSLRTLVGHVPHQAFTNGELQLGETTLPEVLDAGVTGYAHALIGKWHLGVKIGGDLSPNLAGWSHYAGLLGGSLQDYYAWPRTVDGVTATCTTYATTQVVDDTLAWIAQQTSPWLCVVAFNAPHEPFHAPPAHLHTQNLAGATDPALFWRAMVEAMDAEIGRLLAGIDTGATNVVFLGDNGTDGQVSRPPFAPQHAKATPYEGGVNVPLIVAGPDVAGVPRECAALVGAVDLFATVAELAGIDARAVVPPWVPLDSVSLVPYLRVAAQVPLRTYVFSEQFFGSTYSALTLTGWATVRDARYKLVRYFSNGTARDEIYDLLADPFELVDLAPQCSTLAGACGRLRGELVRTRIPRAALFRFGSTCQGSAGIPTIGSAGVPTVGTSYTVTLGGAPAQTAALALVGSSCTSWGALPLPLPLAVIAGAPGCSLAVSPDVSLPALTDSAGQTSFAVPVPFVVDMVGQMVFHQWLVLDVPTSSSDALAAAVAF